MTLYDASPRRDALSISNCYGTKPSKAPMALPNAQQSVSLDPFDKDSFTGQTCHRTAANTDGTDGLEDNAARVNQITAPVLVAGQFRKLDWREVTLTIPFERRPVLVCGSTERLSISTGKSLHGRTLGA
jgi:hypothetical protein